MIGIIFAFVILALDFGFFFGEDMYQYIKPHIHSEYLVESYAKKNKIHPSIVYRSFQYYSNKIEGKDYWGAFKKHFPSPDLALKKLHPMAWDKQDYLPKLSESIKEIFELNE